MNSKKERYLSMSGWVVSDGDFLHWDMNDSYNSIPFRSIAGAVRAIQSKDLSPKASLKTVKLNENLHTYQCRDCDGNMNDYWIYRICEENVDHRLEHHSEF